MKAERHNVSMRELTMRPSKQNGYSNSMEKTLSETPLLRSELGDVLRGIRQRQGRTLREVSSEAQVSLGYLSEVERGQKEASSELLEAITSALCVCRCGSCFARFPSAWRSSMARSFPTRCPMTSCPSR